MRILYLDIETSPNLGYVWGLWNQNLSIGQLVDHTEMLCFGARWGDSKKVEFRSVHHDGKQTMLNAIHQLMDEADVIVGWNSKAFDIKHLHREFLEAGMTPPSPHQDLDLMLTAKQRFKLPSNKLDYVAQLLGVGAKVKHTGFQLWLDCMAGNEKAWRMMKRYQIQDVNLLLDVHDKLRPWIKSVNVAAINQTVGGCPNCGGTRLHRKGSLVTSKTTWQRYQCQDCGTWTKAKAEFRVNHAHA